MPDEGGYVTWTTRAFGTFWGFQVGWWSWVDSFVDVAVYPTLFVEYAKFWYPAMTSLERWLLALALLVALTALNVLGVRPVGRAAAAMAGAALLPIIAPVVAGLASPRQWPWAPFLTESGTLGTSLGLGLAVVMWNYSGWDTPSTCLGETRAPERAFRAALFMALPVIAAGYLLPMTAAFASGADWTTWTTGELPKIARAVGGAWLGHAVGAGAVVSTAGLFMSLLLTNSRLPYVLSREGLMPASLAAVHPRFGTPWVAVVLSAALYAAFAAFSFKELIVLNVWLNSLSLLVELAAFVRLRATEPTMVRPWRGPGGRGGGPVVGVVPPPFPPGAQGPAGGGHTAGGGVGGGGRAGLFGVFSAAGGTLSP